jgi:hypothetical protein
VVLVNGKVVEVMPLQTLGLVPNVMVGKSFAVITTVEVAGVQGPVGSSVVKVRVTVPLLIVGVYVEVKEFTFENVPLAALQVELLALPPMLPAKVIVPPAHTVWEEPALAVAGEFTVIVKAVVVLLQPVVAFNTVIVAL